MIENPLSAVREYDREAARRAAFKLARYVPNQVDCTAHDSADYQAIFLTVAWQAHIQFQKRRASGTEEDERAYCCRAVWNTFVTLRNFRAKVARESGVVFNLDQNFLENCLGEDSHVERAYDARNSLAWLQAEMPAPEWELLVRVAECAGASRGLAEVYLGSDLDGSFQYFYKKVVKAQKKARTILRGRGDR